MQRNRCSMLNPKQLPHFQPCASCAEPKDSSTSSSSCSCYTSAAPVWQVPQPNRTNPV
jgi:hypothetical protein